MSASDRELVSRFAEGGDEEAFRQLFRRHTPRLYAIALRLSGGRQDEADDIVQETWLRAAQRVATFEWRSSLSTWLIGIAINCAREVFRARGALAEVAPLDDHPQVPASNPSVIDLERAIATLSDRHRVIVVLHDIEGWTHKEIAEKLDIAVGTSKSDLFHARRDLRSRLGYERTVPHDRG